MDSTLPPGPSELLVDSLKETSSSDDNLNSSSNTSNSTKISSESTTSDFVDTITSNGEPIITTTITTTGASSISTLFDSNGSVHLRPIAARGLSISKIKSTKRTTGLTFTARTSHFDRDNLNSQKDPFRGFYTLFWIAIALTAARTGVANWRKEGQVWGLTFATLISEDAKMLALTDAIMITVTFVCVPFVQMLNKGWIRYYWTGAILQHILQTAFLGIFVLVTFHREWPWVQSGFMTLHTLSTLMKVHSYCSFNGELSEHLREFKINEKKLNELIISIGGRVKVEEEARKNWEKEGKDELVEGEEVEESKFSDIKEYEPNVERHRSLGSNGDDSTIRQRKSSTSRRPMSPISKAPQLPSISTSSTTTTTTDSLSPDDISSDLPSAGIDLLTWHPNSKLNQLAIATADLRDLLTSTGKEKITFPNNVTFPNFVDYLLVPTLVYQLEYPRTEKIRPMYILEKGLATFGTLSLLILIVEHYILPISPDIHENSFFTSALDLAIPFMVNYLLIFYIIFECICNAFAEITRFADREFYQDWWNSTSFDEFSRRWNIPVHAFLLRHVYFSTRSTYKFSKFQAGFVTFLLSALVHEMLMCIVTKKVRLYLFTMQMCQLPMIYIGSMPVFKKYPVIGNLVFWLGLLSGFPLLAVAYIRF